MISALLLLALAALAVLHWTRQAKWTRAQSAAHTEIETLKEAHRGALTQLQTRPGPCSTAWSRDWSCWTSGRILLANRAFMDLFGLTADVRSRTLLEALRLHELAELVDLLGTQKQVLGRQIRLPHPAERWLGVNEATS